MAFCKGAKHFSVLAVCPPRAVLHGIFEGRDTFFEEELLCSENALY